MSDQFKQKVVSMAKGGQRQEALQYAKQYIHQHPDDVDAWWFVANLVKNPKVKRQCCEHILEVNPFHGEAQSMLDELNAADRPPAEPKVSPFTTEASTYPFGQPASPQPEVYTDPLGLGGSGGQATANPIGIPSIDEFFDDDDGVADNPFANRPSAGNVDLLPLSMKMQADIAKPKPKPSSTVKLDDNTAFALVAVVGIVAVLLIVAAVYFTLHKSSDESTLALTRSETNELFTMKYPATWAVTQYDNNRMVTTNRTLVNTTEIDPWYKFSEGLNSLYPSEAFWDFAVTVEDKAAGEELFVAIMQPIPQPADYIIENMINETKEYYEGDLFLYSIKLDTQKTPITVDAVNTQFVALDATLSYLGAKTDMEFYFVYLVKDEQHYLFTAMVTLPENDHWEAVARDIAQHISFSGGEESVP